MIGSELRDKRQRMGISGHLVCSKAGICRSRLSDIERGYVQPRDKEVATIRAVLDDLIAAKRHLAEVVRQHGWPPGVLK
jgi:transcriptional regulator with XRE-family HTH domain